MKPARKRKLALLLLLLLVLGAVIFLVLYALRQNISLFYTPTQMVQGKAPVHRLVRVGGMVVAGSISRGGHDLSVQFKITDYKHTVAVFYKGVLPDLFREGQGVVAAGTLLDNQRFQATEILAKHDEKYMPPPLKAALQEGA